MPSITGVVRKHGAPLGSAYVRCLGPSGEFVAEIYTGDDGRFTFHVAEGDWTLETRAAGVQAPPVGVAVSGDSTVQVDVEV
jgi:hypothetical protein